MAAAVDTPEPAAWGNHQIFRIKLYRLRIIRRPIKSITKGLTCVAP
jgi:hypothetical protein